MSTRPIATEWYHRAATVAHGHYRVALRFSKLNFWFGFPSVVLATIVGTSVFATLQSKPEIWWQIAVGMMSIAAAILSALQSFLGYSDKAERHRTAGAKYNSLAVNSNCGSLCRKRTWTNLKGFVSELTHWRKSLPISLRRCTRRCRTEGTSSHGTWIRSRNANHLRPNISVNTDALRRPVASLPPSQVAGYLRR